MRTTPRTQWSWQGSLCFFWASLFRLLCHRISSTWSGTFHEAEDLSNCSMLDKKPSSLMPPIMVGIPYTRDITCSVRPNLSEEVWIHFFICEKKWANVSTQHGAQTEICFWPKKSYFQIEKLGCVQDVAFRVKTPCHKDSKGLLQLKKTTNV